MSKYTNEWLADWFSEWVGHSDYVRVISSKGDLDVFQEIVARLRARSEDTERLDFLQSQPVRVDHFDDGRCCVDTPDFQTYSGDSVRAAIDSARKRGE